MVVAIVLVLAAVAIPNMMNVIANARLRGAATSLSGMLQSCRMLAVKENRIKTVYFTSVAVGPYAYVKDAASASTTLTPMDPQVQLGAPIIQVTTPAGGTPSVLDSTTLGYTPLNSPDLPSFNPRGLPCKYVSGTCTNAGFVYYFTDIRRNNAWTAVSISPAGRITKWFWYGNRWGS
jgi:type II secretory pathway pseudopilin PulG